MIPASYFFKNAQCRQWEQPERPEGVPAEPVLSEGRGWFRSLVATFRVQRNDRQSKGPCSQPCSVSAQRG